MTLIKARDNLSLFHFVWFVYLTLSGTVKGKIMTNSIGAEVTHSSSRQSAIPSASQGSVTQPPPKNSAIAMFAATVRYRGPMYSRTTTTN